MKSSSKLNIKFFVVAIIGIIIPQLLLLTMVMIKSLWVFFETGALGMTIFLFLIYHIVFSIILGTKSYQWLKKVYVAIVTFIALNLCHFLLFFLLFRFLCEKLSIDPFGAATILLISFCLMIISIIIFSTTCIFTSSIMKKKNVIDKDSEKENDYI